MRPESAQSKCHGSPECCRGIRRPTRQYDGNAEAEECVQVIHLQKANASACIHELVDDLGPALLEVVQRDARHRALVVCFETHAGGVLGFE